ncbi:MAG TPA: aminofutalosine synthase MqnE [Thermoleophilia bacterium]|nr:aminofutalosine synthase MqnE [Thermoleophilia bacterium]
MNPSEISALAARSGLAHIWRKVEAAERLTGEEATELLSGTDILALGAMADFARSRIAGDEVYFICNRHINHTNVCRNRCLFCAFSHDEGDADAYTLGVDEVVDKARETLAVGGISEIHIVGGEHPDLPFDYYLEMMRALRELAPEVHIQAFTASEISHFAKISGKSVTEVLQELKDAGLGSLPGGGAEVFSGRVRDLICEQKISGQRWLDVMRAAHGVGLKSNATMLYGHVETPEELADHMIRLRELQDDTGGFNAFIPLSFQPANTGLSDLPGPTGFDDLKMLAVGRLVLDNFRHVKAFWINVGVKLAQVSLAFGVNDLDGTVVEEKISHAAGVDTAQELSKAELVRVIRAAGREPVERDTLYNVVRRYDDAG